MSDEMRDGHRAVGTNSGGRYYMVRGSRMVHTTSGETAFWVRDDDSVVDTDTGETRFRGRDDGRGADTSTAETVVRLRRRAVW
jgi:hypothetical protein